MRLALMLLAALSAAVCSCSGTRPEPRDARHDPSPQGTNDARDLKDLDENDSRTIVTMRLVDAHGPLRARRCVMEVENAHGFLISDMSGVTDGDGRVAMRMKRFPCEGAAHIQVWGAREKIPADEGVASIPCPTSDVLDLGEIRINKAPVLVSGVVESTDGTRITGATVTIRHWVESMCGGWIDQGPVKRFTTESDSHGEFTLVGTTNFETISVEVAKPGFTRVKHGGPFIRGVRDLRAVLEPLPAN